MTPLSLMNMLRRKKSIMSSRSVRSLFSFQWPVALLLLVVLVDHHAKGQTTAPSEIQAVEKFYVSLNGDSWYNSTGWSDAGSDPCQDSWFGLVCIYESGYMHIQTIQLPSNNLEGTLPDVFSSLPYLEFLYANLNSISGSFPVSLWSLASLQKLIISSNQISGSLEDVDLPTTLSFLDLSLNQLSGTLPASLWGCVDLTGLLLNGNNQNNGKGGKGGFSGSISPEIGNLLQLSVFHIDQNSFSGTLPDQIFSLPLTELFLGSNQFSGSISPFIGNLSHTLQQLQIYQTEIKGSIPDEMYSLTLLTFLDLSLNCLSGTISQSVGNLKQLTKLNLQSVPTAEKQCQLSGSIPSDLWDLNNMQYLYLSHNLLEGELFSPSSSGPVSLLSMIHLIVFDCSFNLLNGTLPLSGLETLKTLQSLYFSNNKFTGPVPFDSLSQLPLLQLTLSYNQFSGVVDDSILLLNLTTTQILSGNPFICPIPSWASASPWSATCTYWTYSSINPSFVYISMPTNLTVVGQGFQPLLLGNLFCATAVSLPTYKVSNFSLVTALESNQAICLSPPYASVNFQTIVNLVYIPDPRNLSNAFPVQQSSKNSALHIMFIAEASISSINPTNSILQGGSNLNVSGQNFAPTDSVSCLFGGNVSSLATFVNETAIICPIASFSMPGIYSVQVSNGLDVLSDSDSQSIEYYDWCPTVSNGICSDHGACSNSSTGMPVCSCLEQFEGENCENCTLNNWGEFCQPCPDCGSFGSCSQGAQGNGGCSCQFGWLGYHCLFPWLILSVTFTVLLSLVSMIFGFLYLRKRFKNEKEEEQSLFLESSEAKSP